MNLHVDASVPIGYFARCALLLCACDHSSLGMANAGSSSDGATTSASGTGGSANSSAAVTGSGGAGGAGGLMSCKWDAPFDKVDVLQVPGAPADNLNGRLTSDELAVYFAAKDGTDQFQIWQAHRAHRGDPWGTGSLVLGISDPSKRVIYPSVTDDERTIYFGKENTEIYFATRTDVKAPFDPPLLVAALKYPGFNCCPYLTTNRSELWFDTDRPGGPGGYDLWMSVALANGGWDAPTVTPAAALNSPSNDQFPTISSDRLTIFFSSDRGGQYDVWVAHRDSTTPAFSEVKLVAGKVNTPLREDPTWISPDNCRLYFQRGESYRVYVASRLP